MLPCDARDSCRRSRPSSAQLPVLDRSMGRMSPLVNIGAAASNTQLKLIRVYSSFSTRCCFTHSALKSCTLTLVLVPTSRPLSSTSSRMLLHIVTQARIYIRSRTRDASHSGNLPHLLYICTACSSVITMNHYQSSFASPSRPFLTARS